MKMKLSMPPVSLEGKALTKRQLERHFEFNNLEELILMLRKYSRKGYFVFSVFMSSEYLEWEKAHKKILYGSDILQPVDPFGLMQSRSVYGFRFSDSKIENEEPLLDSEIIEVIQKMPAEMTERYLRFKITDIDRVELKKQYVTDSGLSSIDKSEREDEVEYRGMVARDGVISYLNNDIVMPFQERQVVRIFLEKEGGLCTKDDFKTEYASIFNRDDYADIDATLRKLISAVRIRLKVAVGKDCIVNIPSEGWSLDL